MLHILSLPLLAPLLIWQGKRVRQQTIKLPEPDGPRQGVNEKSGALRLLILGDSSAAGVGASHQNEALAQPLAENVSVFRPVNWQLIAKSGVNTVDAINMLNDLPKQQFDIAICILGVNDVTSRLNARHWLRQQGELRNLLRQRFFVSTVIVCGLPPMGKFPALPQPLRWYLGNRALAFEKSLQKDVQNESGALFMPIDFGTDSSLMAEDGFHPGPKAYRVWAQLLAKRIIENVPLT